MQLSSRLWGSGVGGHDRAVEGFAGDITECPRNPSDPELDATEDSGHDDRTLQIPPSEELEEHLTRATDLAIIPRPFDGQAIDWTHT